jgi:phospholipase C
VLPTVLDEPQGHYQYGFRVPLIVVSAYTPKAYVNNVPHDFGSILRFIQATFDIPEGSLGFADERANTDLLGFFDFRRPLRPYRVIPAPLDASFFINDKRPAGAGRRSSRPGVSIPLTTSRRSLALLSVAVSELCARLLG